MAERASDELRQVESTPRQQARRRRIQRWFGFAGLAWLIFTMNAPACVYLPSVPGRPAVMKRIVGADAQGRVHWLEAERDLGFAWGIRWWSAPHLRAFIDFGYQYVPPIRFARGPWSRWRMMRSDGHTRPFDPPLEVARWPGATLSSQLEQTRPHVLPDGSWLVFEGSRLHILEANATEWRQRPVQPRQPFKHSRQIASASRSDGLIVELHGLLADDGHYTEPWQDRLAIAIANPVSGEILHTNTVAFAGDRPTSCGSYGVGLATTDIGVLLLEACGAKASGPGVAQVFRVSSDLKSTTRLARFECERPNRLVFSASSDGELFSTGEGIYRSTGERIRSVGPLSSSAWTGHTLVGVRRYPFFAERVLDRKRPMGEILDGLRDLAKVRGPDSWRPPAARQDSDVYIEILDATGALEKGRWWLGGIDESGKSDEIDRLTVE